MNKWDLSLKSSELEKEFKIQENKTNVKIINMITFVVLATSSLQIMAIFLYDNYETKVFLYFFLYFLAGSICVLVSRYRMRFLNYAVLFSLISYTCLITWSNLDEYLIKYFTIDMTLTPFIRGFILAINFCTGLQGSSFLLKLIFFFFLYFCILYSASKQPLFDAFKLLPTILAFMYKV